MSEFMLIRSGAARPETAASRSTDPRTILARMRECLRDLDGIGAGLAAVHLETAILSLSSQFDLEGDSSGTD